MNETKLLSDQDVLAMFSYEKVRECLENVCKFW